jgi:hypothetical protein
MGGECKPIDIMKASEARSCDQLIQKRSNGLSTAVPNKKTMECMCARMTWVLQGYHPAMNAVEGICEWWESQGEFSVNSPLARRCEMLAHHLADLQHATYGGQAEGQEARSGPGSPYPVLGAGDVGGLGLQNNDPLMAQRLAMASLDQQSVGGLSTNGPYPPGLAVNGDLTPDVFPMPISANVCCEGETRMIVTGHKNQNNGAVKNDAYNDIDPTRRLRFRTERRGAPAGPAGRQRESERAMRERAMRWVPPGWKARAPGKGPRAQGTRARRGAALAEEGNS